MEMGNRRKKIVRKSVILKMKKYKICKRCVMDNIIDPNIKFDKNGICGHCKRYKKIVKEKTFSGKDGWERLKKIGEKIKKDAKGREYDSIIGLSGGIDSTYTAYIAKKKLGLNPLAVHIDTGWNSEIAVGNIKRVLRKLDLSLYTIVINWKEMKDLQLSFFKASVANCDIPQDHAILVGLYQAAIKFKIKYLLNGSNIRTEYIMPKNWGHDNRDGKHIIAIQRKFGKIKLRTFPIMTPLKEIYYLYLKRLKIIKILNYIDYKKEGAKETLKRELGWRDYGGKHYESRFTRFFQTYYLPVKFNIDKRKAHFSNLIMSGEMTREEALKELKKKPYDEKTIKFDKEYIARKLGVSLEEFERILALPPKKHTDYPTSNNSYALEKFIYYNARKILRLIKR